LVFPTNAAVSDDVRHDTIRATLIDYWDDRNPEMADLFREISEPDFVQSVSHLAEILCAHINRGARCRYGLPI
jgi:hypothetical protein